MSAKALAAVLTKPRTFEYQEIDIPPIGPEEGILRVEACGLCGTDYEQYCGHLVDWGGGIPIIPGHEVIGWIEAIGKNAAHRWGVKEGDRAAVEPVVPCGYCLHCSTGAYTRCESDLGYGLYRNFGKDPRLWGGYATHIYLHPRAMVHRLPTDIQADEMSLFNPLSNAVRWAYEVPGTGMGDTLVIEGAGQRGLLAVPVAREAGAKNIIVTGRSVAHRRLSLALELGATATVNIDTEDPVERVRQLTDGRMADVVLDVTAKSTEAVTHAIEMVRRGGTVVLAGLKGNRPIENFLIDKVAFREIRLIGVLSAGFTSIERSIAIIRSRRYPLQKLCSHSYSLKEADQAVRVLGKEVEDKGEVVHITLKVAETR